MNSRRSGGSLLPRPMSLTCTLLEQSLASIAVVSRDVVRREAAWGSGGQTHRSHLDPGVSFVLKHFAFAAAHAEHAAPHLATCFDLSIVLFVLLQSKAIGVVW